MAETSTSALKFPNSLTDWVVRLGIFALFLFFGTGKFTSNPTAPWVVFFKELGFGQWFRYFTGALEMVGAFLVLIPQTVPAGLALLMGTMSGAFLIVTCVLHRPGDAFVTSALLCGMIAFWMHRRRVCLQLDSGINAGRNQGKSRARGLKSGWVSGGSDSGSGTQRCAAGKLA